MGEDTMVEVEMVGREPESVVLARHWTVDGAARHRQLRWEWEELVKLGCSKGQPIFACCDSNCCSLIRRRYLTAAHQPQRWTVVRAIPPDLALAWALPLALVRR
jgi:hypothetical protein